jgi:hypothetical protein
MKTIVMRAFLLGGIILSLAPLHTSAQTYTIVIRDTHVPARIYPVQYTLDASEVGNPWAFRNVITDSLLAGIELSVDGVPYGISDESGAISNPVDIDLSQASAGLPDAFDLKQNRPNPFNPSTEIAYDIPWQDHITLTVFNLLGQEVVRLVDKVQASGRHTVTWNGRDAGGRVVSSGTYLYRLTGDSGHSISKRMILLK